MNEKEDFGSYLKHERELRGVALEDISETTKIRLCYLQALEANQFDDLPGEVFIKGYIRSYAKSIGSDVEEIVNAYDDSVGQERKKQQIDAMEQNKPGNSSRRPLGVLTTLLILSGVVFGGIWWVQNMDRDKGPKTKVGGNESSALLSVVPESTLPPKKEIEPEEKNLAPQAETKKPEKIIEKAKKSGDLPKVIDKPKPSETAAKNDPLKAEEAKQAPVEDKKTSTQEEKGIIIQSISDNETSGAKDQPSAPKKEIAPLQLKIKAKENAWFNLTVDDYREEDFILPGGVEKTVPGNERFRITIGNKANTHLFLNDKPVKLPEVSGDVIRDFIINASLLE